MSAPDNVQGWYRFAQIDSGVKGGVFAVHSDDDIDMLALREYCKKNNVAYKDLKEYEIDKFRNLVSMAH